MDEVMSVVIAVHRAGSSTYWSVRPGEPLKLDAIISDANRKAGWRQLCEDQDYLVKTGYQIDDADYGFAR